MAAIRSLLNPAPEQNTFTQSDPEGSSKAHHYTSDCMSTPQARKKQKLCKDAAIFVQGPIRGECRFPPHEYQDDMIAAQHQQFEVYPIGEIADYPRHIPYNSEKKFFFEKTGRESLEVFQYNFKVPGDDTQYAMLWDYNIGLVRTTPLFKCTGHSKTTPAKMLNRNPGLRDICHSITGGALVAQGYWMPYEAAKAVAATFCWSIRYALTPVFGIDFPNKCLHPDSEKFGDMVIDPVITKRCIEEARRYREYEERNNSQPASTTPTPLTPDTPSHPRHARKFRPKPLNISTSNYLSDTGSDNSYTPSPTTPEATSYRGLWTPANTPRSAPRPTTFKPTLSQRGPAAFRSSYKVSSPEVSPKSQPIRHTDDAYDGGSSEDSAIEDVANATRKVSIGLPSDEKAAYLLMSLRMPAIKDQECRGKKRRASA